MSDTEKGITTIIVVLVSVIVLVSAISAFQPDASIEQQRGGVIKKHGWIDEYEVEGHRYLSRGTGSLIHAAHCNCKKD